MAEFVHVFQAGRMNKDLDERLVPNGEYRDALNLDLANSDASDVGAMQNIAGTIQLRSKVGTGATWTGGYIDAMTNPVCIGSYRDDINERIYWFIASDGISAIAEYDQTKNEVSPVLVDTAGILNFSSDYLITGINILDKFLFWTDDQTEPKKINIEKFKTGSTDFITQTKIPKWDASQNNYNTNLSGQPDFIEADITTIKLSPLAAPTLDIAASKFGNNSAGDGIPGTGLSPVVATYTISDQENFTFIPNVAFAPDDYESMPTYGDYVFNTDPLTGSADYYQNTSLGVNWDGTVTFTVNPIYGNDADGNPVWNIGDILNMKADYIDPVNNIYDYEIRLLISAISGNSITGKIQAISTNILKFAESDGTNIPLRWEIVLEEGVPMFEYVFPRFAYRWKYIDNEYSCFSPFTEVAFVGGKFEYISSDGYNIGMTNNLRKLVINSLTWGSDEVVEIDLLFKQSNSTAVYTVDTLKKADYIQQTPSGTVLNNSYEIKTELIGAVVESNQLLRPWDNVPRKAKSQEIIGNRIVYGNYLQNYNLKTVNLNVDLSRRPHKSLQPATLNTFDFPNQFTGLPEASLKSIRTYQAGIVYKDAYGRETPVFTSSGGSFDVGVADSDSVTSISITPTSAAPDWATHYKFFIKETSNEYYNLAMDRFYPAEDGNVWLSFPSSERNKVSEETYLILKKQHDTSVAVNDLTRYRILAIDNEVPEFVGEFQKTTFGGTVKLKNEIEPGFLTLRLEGPSYSTNPLFQENLNSDNSLRLIKGGNKTEDYQIERSAILGSVGGAEDIFTITLKRPLGGDVSFLENLPVDTVVEIVLFTTEFKNKAEFEGRFFAKINRDYQFEQNIINPFKALEPRYAIVDDIDFPYSNAPFSNGDSNGWRGYHWGDRGWNLADSYLGISCTGEANRHRSLGQGAWGGVGGNLGDDLIANYNPPQAGSFWFGYSYINLESWGVNIDTFTGNSSQSGAFNGLATSGAQIRFVNNNTGEYSDVYTINRTISKASSRGRIEANATDGCFTSTDGNNRKYTVAIELTEPIQGNLDWIPNAPGQWSKLNNALISIQIVTEEYDGDNKLLTSSNPAVFETEPKEAIDLDLYYEASDAFPISTHGETKTLNWYNCYSYGNGVESNRIRDDYNAVFIDKGPKVSSVLDEPYAAERRGSGFIFSQIYNSTSGINRLNQFIQAEPITKDLNPIYGTIQKLHARDTDLISLCEDKCLRVLANKDALFNADGNSNVTSNQAVLGQAVPYAGEFGISKNPESFASYGFRVYFTDKNRGAVIRLSRDGITNIAEKGMSSFFADNLRTSTTAIGSYDDDKDIYNLTLNNLSNYWQKRLSLDANYQLDPDCEDAPDSLVPSTTISFKESVDGWTSRKSFIQESGITLNNLYYTFKGGLIWLHGANAVYNNFYDVQYDSSFNVLINEMPQVVKGFSTLNYTGTASRVFEYQGPNEKWYSIAEVNANQIIPEFSQIKKHGWYTSFVRTDLEAGEVKEFQKKEGKYFNYIKGTLIGCEPDGGGIGPCLDCGEDTPQDYLLTVTIDETCSSSGSPIPDTDFRGWYQWNAKLITSPIIDEPTAQDAKCVIDDFYSQVSGNYAEVIVNSNRFKYVFEDGISVGTQMYDFNTLEPVTTPGCYLYIKNPPGALPNSPALDPDNQAEVPITYFIVIWGADGIIDSVTPYISLTVCQSSPDTYWSMWTTFQVITQETGSHIENLNNYSNALDSKCALEDLYQLTVDETSTGGSQGGIGFYFYSNVGFGEGTQLYAQNGIPLSLNSPGAHLLVRPPAENNLNNDVFIRDNGVSAPDSYEIVIVGSNGVVESITQYNTITGSCSEDPYEPIEGQDFRFIAKKTASPYFGLFDDTLTEVSSPYTFAPLPNHTSSTVAKVSDNYTYMLTGGIFGSEVVHLSTNNGESWSALPFSSTYNGVHISKSGQVIVVESGGFNNALIEVSNNFGDSFTTFNLDNIITLGTSVSFISRLALSSGGKFITISVFANGGSANDSKYRILKSSDYGASFSDITDNVGFPFTNARFTVNIQDALISGNGKYEIYFNAWGLSRYSDDYGETFINKNYPQTDWNENGKISESGKYFMLDSGQTSRYSTDFGASEALLAVPNSSYGDIGVNSSGEFSFTTGGHIDSMSYSNDFFDTFTTIGPVADVTRPFILVDVG